MIERALHTLWQALLAGGIIIPSFSDKAGWVEVLVAVGVALVASIASLAKGWLLERRA